MAEPGTLNLLRWALATALFAPFGLGAFWRERGEIMRLFLPLSAIALCGVSLFDTLIFLAGHTTDALNMTLISTLSPLLTALAAQFFLRQRIGRRMYMGIAASTFGVCLLVTDGDLGRLATMNLARGDLLILLTAVMSVVYNLAVKSVTGRLSQTALLMACCLFGTAQLVPIALWEGGGTLALAGPAADCLFFPAGGTLRLGGAAERAERDTLLAVLTEAGETAAAAWAAPVALYAHISLISTENKQN